MTRAATLVPFVVCLLVACRTTNTVTPMRSHLPAERLSFLTRAECVNTPVLRANLEAALRGRGYAADFAVIDIGGLPPTDPRRRYGTPTILLDNRDLFGQPPPAPGASDAPT